MARHKTNNKLDTKSKKKTTYVLFGIKKDDIDSVGYFGNNLDIVSSKIDAKVFYMKPNDISSKMPLSSFGSPQQWRDLINNDETLNHGDKFHLI